MEDQITPAHEGGTTDEADHRIERDPELGVPSPMLSQAVTRDLQERLLLGGAPLADGERAAVAAVLITALTTVEVARDRGERVTDVGCLTEVIDQLPALCAAAGEGPSSAPAPLLDPVDEHPDPRLTLGLVHDVQVVLREHGYRQPGDDWDRNMAAGRAIMPLLHLVRAFEGRAGS